MERWVRVTVQGAAEVAHLLPSEGWEGAVEVLRARVGAADDQWLALQAADRGEPHAPILTVSEGPLPEDFAGERVTGAWWL